MIDKLQEIRNESRKTVANVELKEKSKFVRELATEIANPLGIELKMNRKML